MAGTLSASPGPLLTPSSVKATLPTNYITNFDFLNQYLPDTYEQEFERYGNRSIASFLRMVGAELPTNSDLIKWAEQGRLHTKYTAVTAVSATAGDDSVTFDIGTGTCVFRIGQTVFLSNNASATSSYKGVITALPAADRFTVAFYNAGGIASGDTGATFTAFVYGSEFKKGDTGMSGSLEAQDLFFDNKPIIIKDKYTVSGSDMAQVGWVEVTTENGATGYYWYMKSEHETRLRFEDYLETAMIEAVPAASGSGANSAGYIGSEGIFYVVNNRGNVWGGGTPTTLSDWDTIVSRLDKQGAIEENVIFVNRGLSFDIDNMLATLNGYTSGGVAQSASFGLFDNDVEMALNLGFSGFRRGYGFYKSDWKYLNDPTIS